MKGLAYVPVLADFCEIDGERDFTTHAFEYDEEEDKIIYYEKQIGCITADEPYMEPDEEVKDRMNVYARVSIPRTYTDAAEIIERKGGTDISVEILVNDMSYSKETGLLLNDITVIGLTCLGRNPETGEIVRPGMQGAHISIEDFSADNSLINKITQAVIDRLDNHIQNNHGKEGNAVEVFDNEVKETEVETETTEEEVVEMEEVETNATEETPEVVEEEQVEEQFDDDDNSGGNSGGSGGTGGTENTGGTGNSSGTENSEPEEGSNEAENIHGDLNNGQNGKKNFAINGKNFEVSLNEIQESIWNLVNETYSENDNEYYSVEVYEGSKTVVMLGIFNGSAYRQSWKVRNGVYSLVGDRVYVKKTYVTADEEAELDKIRSNYAAVSEKLAKYESEPEKMEILDSEDYANISGQKDFEELRKQENHFDLSVEEVKNRADTMLLEYAKKGRLNFAAVEQKKEEPKKDFFAFARVEHDTSFLDSLLKK